MSEKNPAKMKHQQIDSEQDAGYKVSRYTHLFYDDNFHRLLYNAKTNILARVPIEIADIINCQNGDRLLSKLLSHNGLKNKLIKGGFVVEQERDEIQETLNIIRAARNNSSWIGFTIAPTMDCNFSCPYCFEPKGTMPAMDDLTSDKLISFIKEKLEGRKHLSVTWYGGEPTLAIARIEKLTKRIDEIVNSKDIALFCEIITNGYNLGASIRERLASCYISRYQITLDGPPDIHNARRILKNGCGSFWRIVDNIKGLMEQYQVDIRVNIDKRNVNHVDKLVEILSKEGVLTHCSLSFSHVDAITNASSKNKDNCLSLPVFARETSKLYQRNNKYIDNALFPESPHTCAALGPNTYVVDSQGTLYRCWTGIGDKKESIGSVFSPEEISYGDTLASFDIETDPLCKECNVLPICLGGCPYKFIALKESEDRCVKWKYTLEETLRDYAKQRKSGTKNTYS